MADKYLDMHAAAPSHRRITKSFTAALVQVRSTSGAPGACPALVSLLHFMHKAIALHIIPVSDAIFNFGKCT